MVGMIRPESPPWWAVAATVAGGMLAAVQSRLNADLALGLDDPFLAAFISFGSGFAILLALVLPRPRVRSLALGYAADVARGRFPWFYALGGLGGALLVLTQSLVVTTTGVALFIVSIVAGQTLSGLVLDRVGFGPGGPRTLSLTRLAGAALTCLAVAMALAAGIGSSIPWSLLVLPLIAGFGIGYQVGANGIVTQASGHYLVAALGNFAVGSLVLAAAAGVSIAVRGLPAALPANPALYLGGALGVLYIAAAAALVRYTGVLILATSAIAGQIIGSLIVDALTSGVTLAPLTIAGAILTIVAALVTAGMLPARRLSRRSRGAR